MSRAPRLDSAGMWEVTCAWPEQLPGAFEAGRSLASSARVADPPVRAVLAIGVGTGGAACDAAAALTAGQLAVPFVVCHDSEVPAFVGPDCLVVAVACGDMPETLAAARLSEARGARMVGIGSDPALARLLEASGSPWCAVGAAGGATRRAAFGPATVSLLGVLSAAELLPDCAAEVGAAAEFVARRRDAFVADRGNASELARRIGRTIPLVYGSSGCTAVAARWWKSCVNLNAKSPAFTAALPGLTYDELAGWGQGGDITRQTMSMVFLRGHGEPPHVPALFESVRSATEEVMADIIDVWADSPDDLGRLFELALLGDLVSLELAAREGVDPGPVPAVDEARTAQR